MNYTTIEELLMEDDFLAWYHQSDQSAMYKWNEWIQASPEHQHLAEEAVQVLQCKKPKEVKVVVPEHEITKGFNRIKAAISKTIKH